MPAKRSDWVWAPSGTRPGSSGSPRSPAASSPRTRTSSRSAPTSSRPAGARPTPAQRDIAVLGSGAKFQAVTIPPEQAQFLETTRANVATIARYFSVQPELIGGESGGSLTYANVEQRALDFLTFGLRSWLVRLETALSGLCRRRRP